MPLTRKIANLARGSIMQTSELRLTSREANPAPAITESGQVPICRPGDRGRLWINGNDARGGHWRPCVVLCVLADVALVEYSYPEHDLAPPRTALAFIDAFRLWHKTGPTRAETAHPRARLDYSEGKRFIRIIRRPCTYRSLTKGWLLAIVAQYGTWVGASSAGRVPGPGVVLAERFGEVTETGPSRRRDAPGSTI